ncbi:MAG: DUF2711 family protein [Terracidiphilus sp.]|jgi:hypothetical protein
MEAFGGQFESLFVILHPFVSVPEDLAWKVTKKYPSDEQILSLSTKCSWASVAAQTEIDTCAKLNQALLTSVRSIADESCDFQASGTLQSFLQSKSIWMPGSGAFEPLLQTDYLSAFAAAHHEELIFVPEFPSVDPVQRLNVCRLRNRQDPFPSRGTLLAPDEFFLLTVDWDSFFTLFYGPREFVAKVAREQNLEGFFATPTTEHFWFNYSLGCCVVTLAPEVWASA